MLDGTEDRNRDGFRQANETSAIEMDSDRDGLCDGNCSGVGEDLDLDGVKDATETNGLQNDTDGDKVPDGVEFSLMRHKDSTWALSHDFDGDGVSDLNDKDSDDDGLDDGFEDHNRNHLFEGASESDPFDHDTDDDGLWDGAEPSPYVDTDNDTLINVNDTDSNYDEVTDNNQVWVVFRTNAVEGVYSGANTWVAVDAPSTNPHYPDGYAPLGAVAIDYSASVALYKWQGTYSEGSGTPIRNPYGPNESLYESIRELKTPEKYAVYYNGSASPPRIYIQVSATQWERFDKDTSAPGDWSTDVRFDADFLKNKQETYDGRVALNPDTDFDGVTNMAEVACGTNATNNDTDGDGLLDPVEFRACADFDADGHPDANDTDSDDDRVSGLLETQGTRCNVGEQNGDCTNSNYALRVLGATAAVGAASRQGWNGNINTGRGTSKPCGS